MIWANVTAGGRGGWGREGTPCGCYFNGLLLRQGLPICPGKPWGAPPRQPCLHGGAGPQVCATWVIYAPRVLAREEE